MEREQINPSLQANQPVRFKDDRLSLLAIFWPWVLSAGLLSVTFLPRLYPVVLIALLAVCMLVAIQVKSIRVICVFLFGVLWTTLYALWVLSAELDDKLEGQEVQVIGHIIGLPKLTDRYAQFNFDVETLSFQGAQYPSPKRIRLRWYANNPPSLSSGEHWQFLVKLKKPHGSANPGTFNYESWLFSQRIRATGYVRKPDTATLINPAMFSGVDNFRARFSSWLNTSKLEQTAIISALSVGIRQTLSDAQWATLQNTGTNHLIAISGLHIGLVAGFLYFIGGLVWRHTFLITTFYPTQKAAWFFALLGAIIYAALAGFAIPTKRAMIMLITVAALFFIGRRPGAWFALGLVLAVVLLFDPLAPLSAGFWLSFLAVGFILLTISPSTKDRLINQGLSPRRHFIHTQWRRLFSFTKIQVALLVGLAPLLLLTFQKISLVSIVANFIAVPIIGCIVIPLVLMGVLLFSINLPNLSVWFIHLADEVLAFCWPYLESLGNASFAIWQQGITWPVALCALLGSIGLLSARLGAWRWLFALAWVPVLLAKPSTPKEGELWLSVLDVGQGLAVVVQTANHSLLYDTGPRFEGGFDAGKSIVVPYLRHQGIKQLSTIVISHNNIDHIGGLNAVKQQFQPKELIASSHENIDHTQACVAGKSWQWDTIKFEFIYPKVSSMETGNNASCVLIMTTAYGSVLLTGDIEKEAESLILNSANSAGLLNADILVAPHHGSKSSSTPAFIHAVSPKHVVFSAGYRNRFGHPHPAVVDAYQAENAQVYRTAQSGRILFKLNSDGIHSRTYRDESLHYWQKPKKY